MTAAPGSPAEKLGRQPRRFGFDAAVRLLLHASGQDDPADAARFRTPTGGVYVGADILTATNAATPHVTVTVMGLTGVPGVLPPAYGESVSATRRDRSHALHDFLDMLSHRPIAAFARAGAKYRPNRAIEVGALRSPPTPDPVARLLLALTGYGTPGMAERLQSGSDPLLHYSGIFATRPRSADRLAALASDWLGRPVRVDQFAGAWLSLPPDQRSRLPSTTRAGAFGRLGVDAAIGVRAWDVQARVVLVVGPLDAAAFAALLPDRPGLRRFVGLVRAFLGWETGFAVRPVLAADAVPPLRLDPAAQSPARLGWNTWMPTAGARRTDAADALFEAETVEAEGAR